MSFFVRCLSTLIIGLSLSTTLLLCQENVNAEKFLKILDVLDTNRLKQIEDALNHKVEDICKILTGEDADQREAIIKQLNSIFTTLWRDIIASDYANIKNEIKNIKSEIKNIKTFVNTVFVPNQVPNSFFCAWIIKVEILEDVYKKEKLQIRGQKMDFIFELADKATKLSKDQQIITIKFGKRTLSNVEFIAVLKTLAPGVEESLLQEVACHCATEYKFRGNWCYYHEKVLLTYTAWIEYIEHSGSHLKREIVSELKLYYKNNWEVGAKKFALTLSRDHFIGNSIRHYFWEEYQKKIIRNPDMDFDEILDSAFPEGWYYTQQSLDHFHLLVRALKKADRIETEPVLQYEPFLQRSSVGMPQSLACRYSKRDFDYFSRRWVTTTLIPTRNMGT